MEGNNFSFFFTIKFKLGFSCFSKVFVSERCLVTVYHVEGNLDVHRMVGYKFFSSCLELLMEKMKKLPQGKQPFQVLLLISINR